MLSAIRKSNRGFTLVEVMIAMTVFVALAFVFAACVPVARKTSKMNSQYSQAISLCQHKIDQLRAVGYGRLNYDELSDAEIIDTSPTTTPFTFTTVDQVSDYLINPSTSLTITTTDTNVIQVTAAITWSQTSYGTRTSTASLTALITNVE